MTDNLGNVWERDITRDSYGAISGMTEAPVTSKAAKETLKAATALARSPSSRNHEKRTTRVS